MFNSRGYTHICYYFFWHLPSVTFVNGFPHVYMHVSKEIRSKITPPQKKIKMKQICTHTNISNKQKSLVKSFKIFLTKHCQQVFIECLQWVRNQNTQMIIIPFSRSLQSSREEDKMVCIIMNNHHQREACTGESVLSLPIKCWLTTGIFMKSVPGCRLFRKRKQSMLRYRDREDNDNPLQYSCLENPMDGKAWQAAVHEVAKSRIRLSDFTFTFHFHALEKKMAAHSSVLAWRIPGTEGPGGLLSMGSRRVGHN